MNHASLNTSAVFGIFMCCGSIIYSLTITKAITVISKAAIDWRFGVFVIHMTCFCCGLSV